LVGSPVACKFACANSWHGSAVCRLVQLLGSLLGQTRTLRLRAEFAYAARTSRVLLQRPPLPLTTSRKIRCSFSPRSCQTTRGLRLFGLLVGWEGWTRLELHRHFHMLTLEVVWSPPGSCSVFASLGSRWSGSETSRRPSSRSCTTSEETSRAHRKDSPNPPSGRTQPVHRFPLLFSLRASRAACSVSSIARS
jgi:hypothetical protein